MQKTTRPNLGFWKWEVGRLFDGKFAILGDNRSLPRSTIHAVVSKEKILGKVVFSVRLGRQRVVTAEGT